MTDGTALRKCIKCGVHRPLDMFYKGKKNRPCAPCARERMNARVAEKTAYIQRIKLERGCADCGLKIPHPEVYDFDHRPGVHKVAKVAQMRLGNMAALVAEIEKCDVVCANCHRIRTASRRDSSSNAKVRGRKKRNGYAVDIAPEPVVMPTLFDDCA